MEASSASPDSSLPLDHLPAVLMKPKMLHLSAEGEETSQHILFTKLICIFMHWPQQFWGKLLCVTSTHAGPPVAPACSLVSVDLLYHNWRWAKEQMCLNQGSFCYLKPKKGNENNAEAWLGTEGWRVQSNLPKSGCLSLFPSPSSSPYAPCFPPYSFSPFLTPFLRPDGLSSLLPCVHFIPPRTLSLADLESKWPNVAALQLPNLHILVSKWPAKSKLQF